MSFTTLDIERRNAVTHVWLNRPKRLNALNTVILEELAECFAGLQRDFGTKVVVLGGRGRSFSSGADRKEGALAERFEKETSDRSRRYATQVGRRAMEAIANLEAVTIARVQGHAIGGGLCLALACDFRIAAGGAQFQIPEVDLGVPLTWGAVPRLIAEIGPLLAREWIMMCNRIDAMEALSSGFLNRVVPEEQLDTEINDWADRLAQKSELAVHMTKTQFRSYARRAVLGDVSETDGDLIASASSSDFAREAFSWKTR